MRDRSLRLLVGLGSLVLRIHCRPTVQDYASLSEFSESVRESGPNLRRLDIAGWLSDLERKALYELARWLPGPFLEVGPWVGLSTTIICMGIQDSGSSKTFITAEINPGPDNFRPFGEGIGFFIPADTAIPKGVTTVAAYERDIRPVVEAEGGVIGQLRRNLLRYGQLKRVDIVQGHFQEVANLNYRFIFMDAMHDEGEIRENARLLAPFLSTDCVLACHDISGAYRELLLDCIKFGEYTVFDTLFVGRVG